jgi:hypothetical protein
LLDAESVRKELKLTAEQEAKIRERRAEFTQAVRQRSANMKGKSREEMIELQRGQWKVPTAVAEKVIQDVLSPAQQKRLYEVFVQMCGVSVFIESDEFYPSLGAARRAVQLTDAQKEQFQRLAEDYRREGAVANPLRSSASLQERLEKVMEVHKRYVAKVDDILTGEQKKALAGLKGEPFDLIKIPLDLSKTPSPVEVPPPPSRRQRP